MKTLFQISKQFAVQGMNCSQLFDDQDHLNEWLAAVSSKIYDVVITGNSFIFKTSCPVAEIQEVDGITPSYITGSGIITSVPDDFEN